MLVRAENGEERLLPPWPGSFRLPGAGTYRALTTGAEVVDPDLGCFLELHQRPDPG